MNPERSIAVLEELLAAKGEHLRRTATLLAGGPDDGEDLLQAALERVFRRRRTAITDPEGYLRRTMYNLAADGWRRRQSWRDKVPLLSQPAATPDPTSVVDDRDHLTRLLRVLPPRQRAAIVLRYWEDLSEQDAALAMGCSAGTVKAAVSRGLARLRELSEGPSPGGRLDRGENRAPRVSKDADDADSDQDIARNAS
jgi:RNA polymerase sigma-70 factor (sigma-E family)